MKINHVALYVKDLEKSREFYEKYFNAKANNKYRNLKTGLQTYFLSFPNNDVRLEIMSRPELTDREDKIMNIHQAAVFIAIPIFILEILILIFMGMFEIKEVKRKKD